MNEIDLTKPSRQSAKGLVLIFLFGLQKFIRAFWPLFIVYVIKIRDIANFNLAWIGACIILLLLVVHSILYYLNFNFYISGEEFILKKGYLRKQVLSIPLERIQSVNTKQNLLQQILNVVTLEIDTAGTIAKELKIHALDIVFAKELQNYLSSYKKDKISDESVKEDVNEKLILQLQPADLFKIGISENHIRAGLIILAFGFQIYQKAEEVFKEKANEYPNEVLNFMSNSGWALITFLIISFLLISVLFSLSRTVYKYYGFSLFKSEDVYRVISGLINKRNAFIPISKVQELNWTTGPIKQQFGIYNLAFKQAVSGQNRKNQVVDAPGCLNNHLEMLKFDLFGEEKLKNSDKVYSNSYYFRRLWLIFGFVPVTIPIILFYNEWLIWVAAALWLSLSAAYCYLIIKKRYFRMNDCQIRVSGGAITHKWKQMELFKIQSVEFRQTIFQKRRMLASLRLSNASGSIRIPYIDAALAKRMYNYLLFHTETSRKNWM